MGWTESIETPKSEEAENEPSLGTLLRDRRLFLGKSLEEIAHRLRIRKSILEALENNQPIDLPALSYTRGFIRGYALELGLDPQKCLLLFQNSVPPLVLPLPPLSIPLPRLRKNRVTWPFVLLGLLGLGATIFFFLTRSSFPDLPLSDPSNSSEKFSLLPLNSSVSSFPLTPLISKGPFPIKIQSPLGLSPFPKTTEST